MSLSRLQELHKELQEKKEERKKLRQVISDELKHNERHTQLVDEMGTLKEEKKSIENHVRESVPQDAQKLDDLNTEIKADEELMSDLTINLIMKNESVELHDQYENKYVPLLKVTFKREK